MSILAGAASLVDSVNASSSDAFNSEQHDDQLAANSAAAHSFIEDMDLSIYLHLLFPRLSHYRLVLTPEYVHSSLLVALPGAVLVRVKCQY